MKKNLEALPLPVIYGAAGSAVAKLKIIMKPMKILHSRLEFH